MPKIPFLNDANIVIYLLYPTPYLKRYQNNNTGTRTNSTIIGNNTRLPFAVLLALNTLSMGPGTAGTNICAVITSLVNNVLRRKKRRKPPFSWVLALPRASAVLHSYAF